MCGIVGYIGSEEAAPILLDGLSRLEYRGYDSAGVAVYSSKDGLEVAKAKGRLQVLYDIVNGGKSIDGTVGLGHTRWATHGEPSDVNSHPQVSASGRIAVVHNGIIENYVKIKEFLMSKDQLYLPDRYRSSRAASGILLRRRYSLRGHAGTAADRGGLRVRIICADCPDKLIAARRTAR